MEYSAAYIKEILDRFDKKLKKSLGQNFLFDKRVLDAIVQSAVVDEDTNVVEIGAGVGLLTDLLCQNARKVVTVEIDDSLEVLLSETLPHQNFHLHLEDVLKADFKAISQRYFASERFTVVGNLPYYITAKILDKLTREMELFSKAVIMVQKEVALRLMSKTGSKEYRAASVTTQALFDIEYVCSVPPHSFVPAPHVESAVIALTPKADAEIQASEREAFVRFVENAFLSRRKQLKSVAKTLGYTPEQVVSALEGLHLCATARAESLTPKQMIALYKSLT